MKKIFSIIVEVHLSEDTKQTAVLRNVNGLVIGTCHCIADLPQMLADINKEVFTPHVSK